MQKKKRQPNFGKQKRAFDQVLEAYRRSHVQVTGLGCINLRPAAGVRRDPAKPIPAEFRCDVEQTVEDLVGVKYHQWFWAAYSWYDGTDVIEREMFAQRLLGDRRHSWEQRLGAKFIEIGLYPMTKYFGHTRL
jgi:hypothetical protein